MPEQPSGDGLLHAAPSAVAVFLERDGQLVPKGRMGCAIVGNSRKQQYRVVLYTDKKEAACTGQITPDDHIVYRVNQGPMFGCFRSDTGQVWSVTFANESEAENFAASVGAAYFGCRGTPRHEPVNYNLLEGSGEGVVLGDWLAIQCTGWLLKENPQGLPCLSDICCGPQGSTEKPCKLQLGQGLLPPEIENGLEGMKKGGKRVIVAFVETSPRLYLISLLKVKLEGPRPPLASSGLSGVAPCSSSSSSSSCAGAGSGSLEPHPDVNMSAGSLASQEGAYFEQSQGKDALLQRLCMVGSKPVLPLKTSHVGASGGRSADSPPLSASSGFIPSTATRSQPPLSPPVVPSAAPPHAAPPHAAPSPAVGGRPVPQSLPPEAVFFPAATPPGPAAPVSEPAPSSKSSVSTVEQPKAAELPPAAAGGPPWNAMVWPFVAPSWALPRREGLDLEALESSVRKLTELLSKREADVQAGTGSCTTRRGSSVGASKGLSVEQLCEAVNGLAEDRDRAEEDLRRLRVTVVALQDKLGNVTQELERAQQQLRDVGAAASDKTAVEALQRELAEARLQLREQAESSAEQLAGLRRELEQASAARTELHLSKDALKSSNHGLTEQLSAVEAHRDTVLAQLEEAQVSLKSTQEALSAQCIAVERLHLELQQTEARRVVGEDEALLRGIITTTWLRDASRYDEAAPCTEAKSSPITSKEDSPARFGQRVKGVMSSVFFHITSSLEAAASVAL
eukprot:RCo019699